MPSYSFFYVEKKLVLAMLCFLFWNMQENRGTKKPIGLSVFGIVMQSFFLKIFLLENASKYYIYICACVCVFYIFDINKSRLLKSTKKTLDWYIFKWNTSKNKNYRTLKHSLNLVDTMFKIIDCLKFS